MHWRQGGSQPRAPGKRPWQSPGTIYIVSEMSLLSGSFVIAVCRLEPMPARTGCSQKSSGKCSCNKCMTRHMISEGPLPILSFLLSGRLARSSAVSKQGCLFLADARPEGRGFALKLARRGMSYSFEVFPDAGAPRPVTVFKTYEQKGEVLQPSGKLN